jgi:hypothetical protein
LGNIVNEVDKNAGMYAKAPLGPSQVVEYLGRYSHKIAITKHRIVSVTDTHVNFRYKDYDQDKNKIMSLERGNFTAIRNAHFAQTLHKNKVLWLLQNHGKRERLARIRESIQLSPMPEILKNPSSNKNARKVWERSSNVRVALTDDCK